MSPLPRIIAETALSLPCSWSPPSPPAQVEAGKLSLPVQVLAGLSRFLRQEDSVMTNRTHTGLLLSVFAAGIGCGSQGNPTVPSPFVVEPGPITQPGSGTRTSNTVPPSNAGVPGAYRFDAAMSRSGTATVTLTWPNGDFSLQLYVTAGECADTTS